MSGDEPTTTPVKFFQNFNCFFMDTLIPYIYLSITKVHIVRGDLSDISAGTATLINAAHVSAVLQPGEIRKIDNGFLVAWTASMQYTINLASKSIVASLLSGEAIVTTFTGPGTIIAITLPPVLLFPKLNKISFWIL